MVVNECDIAIVGGGIQGLFLAYYAKKKNPFKKISLFESNIVGSGITSYSGHLHLPYGEGFKNELAKISLSIYAEFYKEFADFPLERRKIVGICNSDKIDSVMENLTEKNVSCGLVEYHLSKLPPKYTTISGLEGYVSHRNLSIFIMALIAKMGVKIYECTPIIDINRSNDKYYLLNARNERIISSIILNATGKGVYKLLCGGDIKLRTKKVVALHIDQSSFINDSIYYFFDDDAFLLPQPNFSRYLFSYRCEEWDVDVDSKAFIINKSDITYAKSLLHKYADGFSDRILGGQVSIDIYNDPSSTPLITEIDKGFFVVGATGGSGVRLAPALAIKVLEALNC